MKQSKTGPPAIYAIWAEARLDGPLQGRSGFLSEDGYRLFFTSDTEMDQKIQDLRGLCLNRTPAVTYHGVAYPGDHDISAGISVEQIKACDLRPDFDSTRYEITQRIYGNTGGGCMVGTLAVRYPELEKTLWIHCNDEGVSVSSADYVWNEDHSGSWARYEDVSIMEIDFWEQSPEDAGALFPAIQDTVTYTIQQAVQNSNRPFRIPAKWLPEAFCQTTDSEYIKWAVEVEHAVEVGKEGVIINDPMYLKRNAPQMIAPGTICSWWEPPIEGGSHVSPRCCPCAAPCRPFDGGVASVPLPALCRGVLRPCARCFAKPPSDPAKCSGVERRCGARNEFCRLRRSERYGACNDVNRGDEKGAG